MGPNDFCLGVEAKQFSERNRVEIRVEKEVLSSSDFGKALNHGSLNKFGSQVQFSNPSIDPTSKAPLDIRLNDRIAMPRLDIATRPVGAQKRDDSFRGQPEQFQSAVIVNTGNQGPMDTSPVQNIQDLFCRKGTPVTLIVMDMSIEKGKRHRFLVWNQNAELETRCQRSANP